jgi:hypothetical protein
MTLFGDLASGLLFRPLPVWYRFLPVHLSNQADAAIP